MKCDGTRAETRFRLPAKRTSPFKSAGASVQSTTGSRGLRISGSNAGYTMFRGSVKGTGYPLHSPVSPSLPLPCVTVRHHISHGLYMCLKTEGGGLRGDKDGKYYVMSIYIICRLVCTGCCVDDHYNRETYAKLVYIAPGKISNA